MVLVLITSTFPTFVYNLLSCIMPQQQSFSLRGSLLADTHGGILDKHR